MSRDRGTSPVEHLTFSLVAAVDHDEVSRLLTAAFTVYVERLGKTHSGRYPWLTAAIAEKRVHVARDGKTIVGVICTTKAGKHLKVDQFGVAPTRQGSGIGSWMLARLEAYAIAEGASRITLYTGAMMEDLLLFYQSHGYVETHRALPDHGEDSHLRAHMRKDL